jgi:hypothetical protein
MKKLINVQEVEGEGLEALMGEKVTLFCMNYFYTGKLIGVNKTCVLLEDPAIIYDTGSFSNKSYADAQPLCVKTFYVQIAAIESFGVLK